MRINLDNINFCATYICTTNIKKNNNSNLENYTVKVVELDENCKADYDALNSVANDWKKYAFNNDTFANSILNDISIRKKHRLKTVPIYAITTQKDNFEHVDSKKVLGIAEFSSKGCNNRIEYLQVNPKYIKRYYPDKNFFGIGVAILEFLKSISDKPIELTSSKAACKFYEKNGFIKLNTEENEYIWFRENN